MSRETVINSRWYKVINDLWHNKTRTLLVVLAIAVGVAAFGGVFITRNVLLTDMETQWSSINPSNISISFAVPVDEEVLNTIRETPGVTGAEGRSIYPAQVITADDQYNLDMHALHSYDDMQINRITSETGAWPPGEGEILLERASAILLEVESGDTITVKLPTGEERTFLVAGLIHDLNATPATMHPYLTGYVDLETLRQLDHSGLYDRINVTTEAATQDEIDSLASTIKKQLLQDGYIIAEVRTRESSKHWGEDTTNAFTGVLGGIGLFTLALSGFLVVNTILSIITHQKRQIGMMKAVGASGGQIVGIYFIMVMIFGLLALVVALPVGMALAYLMTEAVVKFLNIDILNFTMPLWVIALQGAMALAAPLIAALFPILHGTRITVREAISDYGIAAKQKENWFDRWLNKIHMLPRPALLSLRNTFRRKGRLILTLSTLTLSGAIFIAVVNSRTAMIGELMQIFRLFQYDVEIGFDELYPTQSAIDTAEDVPGVTHVESWSFVQATYQRPDGEEGISFRMTGLPPDSPFVDPLILEGRWLRSDDEAAIVVSSTIILEEPEIQVGDEITLLIGSQYHDFEVIGIVNSFGQNHLTFATESYLSQLTETSGQTAFVYIGAEEHDGDSQAAIARRLEEQFKESGMGVEHVMTRDEFLGSNLRQVDFMIGFLLTLSILIAIVGGLGLTSTMSLNVLERTREIGVLRAIGAPNGVIQGIVISEAVLISLISWTIGIAVSLPITHVLNLTIGQAILNRPMVFKFEPLGVVIWLGIVIIISITASLIPARRAVRISVQQALAYE